MNDYLKNLEENLYNLDCIQSNIEKVSEEFLNILAINEISIHDLMKLWRFYLIKKTNKLPYIYLINDIMLNSSLKKINIHEILFSYLFDSFPLIYFTISERMRKEIHKILDIWNERNFLDSEKFISFKYLLKSKLSIFENLNNPLFPIILLNKKIKIFPRLVDYAFHLKKLNDNNLGDLELIENNNKLNKNNIRGKVLIISSDLLKNQNQIFFKHVFYLQEIDKMIKNIEK